MRIFQLLLCGMIVVSVFGAEQRSEPSLAQQSHAGAHFTSLYSFKGGTDGSGPSGLIAINGALYGTTDIGGAQCIIKSRNNNHVGCGTVFEVSPSGQERVLYRFQGAPDGAGPFAGLIAVNGKLYGTTSQGGNANNKGTVFEVSTSGQERVLYRFRGKPDGDLPAAGLVAFNGALYGTTCCGGASDDGTVFELSLSGPARVVYSFKGGTDGSNVLAGLLALNGGLYGTTQDSGGCLDPFVCGTVFEVTPSGQEHVVYTFIHAGRNDGNRPQAGLVALNGALYGTTCCGGEGDKGTVFAVSPSGQERVLYRFRGKPDGREPDAGLVALNGTFYGTTCCGGAHDKGTVFALSPSGRERVLHSFAGGTDGAFPRAALIVLNGMLYGTTGGDTNDHGTVFAVSP
jgi:uncharacterized repeat protein (TIGR03803 family)